MIFFKYLYIDTDSYKLYNACTVVRDDDWFNVLKCDHEKDLKENLMYIIAGMGNKYKFDYWDIKMIGYK